MNVSVCGALNLESVDDKPYQFLGGAFYVASSIARYVKDVNLLGCIGTDITDDCLELFRNRVQNNNLNLFLNQCQGLNFKHNFYTKSDVESKNFGDYRDFIYTGKSFATDYLIMVSGSPKLYKSVLNHCTEYNSLVFDSKIVYYQTIIDEVIELFNECSVYSANSEEMDLLMNNFEIHEPHELFKVNPKLNIIIHHCHAAGGTLYRVDGRIVQWSNKRIEESDEDYKNDIGAGDVFIGTFMGNYIKYDNIIEAIRDAAAASFYSIMKIGANIITAYDEYQHCMQHIKITDAWRF